MYHAVLVATVFALLLCPYRCMGGLTAGTASASAPSDERPRSCRCCTHRPADGTPADEAPGGPMPGELPDGCCACLCEGATVGEDDDVLRAAMHPPEYDAPPPETALTALFLPAPGLTFDSGGTPPPHTRPAGRILLFAVRSLRL
jgi:hypothetical protein